MNVGLFTCTLESQSEDSKSVCTISKALVRSTLSIISHVTPWTAGPSFLLSIQWNCLSYSASKHYFCNTLYCFSLVYYSTCWYMYIFKILHICALFLLYNTHTHAIYTCQTHILYKLTALAYHWLIIKKSHRNALRLIFLPKIFFTRYVDCKVKNVH